MSGVVSGISKVFSSLAGGAAKLGSAVTGVGGSLFTAGAATGGSAAGSSLFGGTLGSMFKGAASLLTGGLATPLMNGATAAVGTGAGAAAPTGFGAAFGNFMSSEGGAGLISGLGAGLGNYAKMKAEEEQMEKDRDAIRQREARITGSYDVAPDALMGNTQDYQDTAKRPTPAVAYAREKWRYNKGSGQIEAVQ